MTKKQLLFSFKGRINRWTFLHYITGTWALYGSLFLLVTLPAIYNENLEDYPYSLLFFLIIMPMGIAKLFWIDPALAVKRLHDIGKSGWSLIPLYIPVIGIVFQLIIAFSKGNPERNKYGEPPPPGCQ